MFHIAISLIIFGASFVFAMLGLGGGMVYVPVLKWAGYDVKQVAIPLGLLLNGLNTLLALIPFIRKRLVDWKGGAAMAAAAFVAAPFGAALTGQVPVDLLMGIFAGMVLLAAFRMLHSSRQPEPEHMMPFVRRSLYGALIGAVAGFSGGLLGIGGGFIIAPLLMWMGYRTSEAAATTAFVVTISSLSGYAGHMASGSLDWPVTLAAVVAVIIGSQLGASYHVNGAKPAFIKKVYALMLFAIAVKLVSGIIL